MHNGIVFIFQHNVTESDGNKIILFSKTCSPVVMNLNLFFCATIIVNNFLGAY